MEFTNIGLEDRKINDITLKCHNCENNYKYKCPACNVKSCCLKCVNVHKQKTGCDGNQMKRHISQNIPITRYNINDLCKDFNFLEDVRRRVINIKRDNKNQKESSLKFNCNGNENSALVKVIKDKTKSKQFTPIPLLRKACNMRNIKISFCPVNEMNIRKTNTTYYDKKNDHILWKMEFLINEPNSKSSRLILDNISENEIILERLNQIIENFNVDKIKIFLINNTKDKYLEKLEVRKTFKENLSGKKIVEFPRINVIIE